MNLILIGALGRMGAHVAEVALAGGHTIAAYVDIGYASSGGGRYRHITEVEAKADAIIDFSFHTVTPEVVAYAAEKGIPAVIATTGHDESEKAAITAAAEKTAIFSSGNMSVGIATLCDTVRRVVSVFPDADVEIVETHHNRKLDVPSGTALMIADALCEVRPEAYTNLGRSGQGKRTHEEIGIHAIRMGNVVGEHEVILATQNQTVTLKHEAHSRALFAEGALAAAEYLANAKAGLHDMKSLVGQTAKNEATV